MNLNVPVIPETITVHLGPPNSAAQNVTVPFSDYIKNVASSEIFPTWPESTLRANILAQVSFALNRVYTEYYRSRGYDFDITNSTAYDQSFVNGREFFQNIIEIVDDVFDDYIRRKGTVEPLFAQYCNGTTTTCDGLSQWGSVSLGDQGLNSLEILQAYYGDDIEIVTGAPVANVTESYPDPPLRVGSRNDKVRTVQVRLNRVSTNYPAIPKIYPEDGIFGFETEQAVRKFQEIFNLNVDGMVGKQTWNELTRVWTGVKQLAELTSEGVGYEEVVLQYTQTISPGDSGVRVLVMQHYLDFIAQYENSIAAPTMTGVYDDQTVLAVQSFQKLYGLPVDSNVDENTWNAIYDVYIGIVDSLPDSAFVGTIRPYPGVPLRQGATGPYVEDLQEYLNVIGSVYTQIPNLTVDGQYGSATKNAVEIFQETFGIPVTGIVDLQTWRVLGDQYSDIEGGRMRSTGQYPGYEVGAT
ncbi:MAG: spore cortex-lytic protein [Clostridiales bacterium]|nr:spore cortex-lytic protein [Clostridiales bacterium]